MFDLLLSSLLFSQAAVPSIKPSPTEIVRNYPVYPLPGKLDSVPVFNSNSPEWVKKEGILLSTLSPKDKKSPNAHLNFAFQGRFDIFTHHFSHTPKDNRTLYIGVILHNPSSKPVTIDILQAASHLMQNAPYVTLANYVENPQGQVYSGPGDRAVNDVLRGQRNADFPAKIVIPPGQNRLLMNHPIPVKGLERLVNGRSSLIRLQSNGQVQVASLALYAPQNADRSERKPTQAEWENLLKTGDLAGPRDKTPSPPDQKGGQFIYGRVAGVSQGATWKGTITNPPNSPAFSLPKPGEGVSYPIASLKLGTLGTNQNQTARMIARYPDTAYEAHGNYAVEYNLTLPLVNPSQQSQTVALTLETPIKEDKLSRGGLRFRRPSLDFPFFRGTVRLQYTDEAGKPQTRYVHLWHRTAQVLDPLLTLKLSPQSRRTVQLDVIYPPDSTPPQVLTVRTLP